MKSLIISTFCCLFILSSLHAQREETVFSGHGFRLSGIWGAATYNYASFGNNLELSRGGYFGFEISRRLLIGWGHQRMTNSVDIAGTNNNFKLKTNFFMLAFTPNSRKAIHPKITLLTGNGRAKLNDSISDRVFVFQPSAGIEVNIFQFFRLGLEGGYRLVSDTELPNIENADLSAPFGQINLQFGLSWGR